MTTPNWIEPKISIGHILQALVLVAGGLIAFFDVKSDVRINSERLSGIERVQEIEIGHIKDSLRRIEKSVRNSRP